MYAYYSVFERNIKPWDVSKASPERLVIVKPYDGVLAPTEKLALLQVGLTDEERTDTFNNLVRDFDQYTKEYAKLEVELRKANSELIPLKQQIEEAKKTLAKRNQQITQLKNENAHLKKGQAKS